MVSTFTGPAVYTEQEKYQKIPFSDIEKDKAKFNSKADNGWIAMVQHYFVTAWIPPEKLAREFYVDALSMIKSNTAYDALTWLRGKETDPKMLRQIDFALKKSKFLSQ